MFIRILISILFLNFATIAYSANLLRLPTAEQIEKLCVPIVMSTDHDVHYFYYKHVIRFDEAGISVRYGRHLEKATFIPREQIENYFEALEKYNKLVQEQP